MEPVEKGKDALLSGIETDVRAEEQEIIAEAEKRAVEKRKYAEGKAESILNDASKQGQSRAEEVKKKVLSGVGLEIKRRGLGVQAEVMEEISNRVEEKLATRITGKEYRSVLTDLIVEAAIGLDAESAQINASEKERKLIDERLLSEVRRIVQASTDKSLKLTLSDSGPLVNQGVVLTAADGRTAFNNQIKTRMLRKQGKIRTLIYDALFDDDREE